MRKSGISDEILAVLDSFVLDNEEDIAREVAENFRRRRVEKNITRQQVAEQSGVPLSTVARFEQKGLISFDSLIRLAMALGYTPDIRRLFGEPHYTTMAELDLIRRKQSAKRAYRSKSSPNPES